MWDHRLSCGTIVLAVDLSILDVGGPLSWMWDYRSGCGTIVLAMGYTLYKVSGNAANWALPTHEGSFSTLAQSLAKIAVAGEGGFFVA